MSILGLIITLIIFILIFIYKNEINKKLEEYIPFEIYITITEFINLVKNKKVYIILFFILIIPMSIIILIMFLIYIQYTIYLTIKFINCISKKSYKVMKYKEWKTKFKNDYLIIMKKVFWEKPTTLSFYNFYNILKLITEKNKKINIDLILIFLWNLIIRIVIVTITKIPLIVSKSIMEFLIKTNNILKSNNKKINIKLIKYIIIQYIISTSSEINHIIKKLKIKFLKKKIKFNPDFKKLLNSLKNKKGFKEAMFLTKQKTEINFIRHIKEKELKTESVKKFYMKYNKNLFEKLKEENFFREKLINKQNLEMFLKKENVMDEKTENFLENNIQKTKLHLTILYRDENGNIIYKNESSKDILTVYNNNTKRTDDIKLKFLHKGSTNQKKITYYTPNIITEENNIEESQNENIIENIQNIENSTHNLLLAFLLDAKEEGLTTQYIETERKICLMKEDKKTGFNILKTLEKDKVIKQAQEIFENFLEENKEIFQTIPIEKRYDIMREVLSNYYKTDLFKDKDLIFFILKKD